VTISRLDAAGQGRTDDQRADKLRGVFIGVITANTDEGGDSKYKVKVNFPWLPGGKDTSYWARIVVPMAGKDMGTYCFPSVDDQVLVVFEHGDIRRPIVIGSMWSNKQKPPETNSSGKNNIREIKSDSGHRLIFDDTDGSERVILVDATGENKILLDAANDMVTVETANGDIEMKASASGARLHGKTLNITTKDKLGGKGGMMLEVISGGALNAKASGDLILKGSLSVGLNMPGAPAIAMAGGGGSGSKESGAAAGDQVAEGDGASGGMGSPSPSSARAIGGRVSSRPRRGRLCPL
jgi:phage baseplate assembly protein gpV